MKKVTKKVEIYKPKSWVKYSPSLCKGCWAGCCTLPVLASSEDLYHMGYLKAEQVEGPLKAIANRLKKQGIIQSYRDRTRIFTLKQRKGGDCIFLDQNRMCTIYDRRPSVCRAFPFNSVRPGFCPKQDKTKVSSPAVNK